MLKSIKGLVAFSVAVETGCFAAAGRKLGLSASAVGKAVDRLEQRLRTKLLTRTNCALGPTVDRLKHRRLSRCASIYVAPPDHHLLLESGQLRLSRGPKEHFARPAIDPLFRSAALHSGSGVVGVVLTGMLDDGTSGLRAIQACGGTTIVQDPEEAVEPSMPQSAISSMKVDHIVRLDAVADLLNKLARSDVRAVCTAPEWLRIEHAISLGKSGLDDLRRIGNPSSFTCPDCGGALFELNNGKPVRFLCHTGHAFSLRSLATAQEDLTEETLWAGLRALQEKEAILRRLAKSQSAEMEGSDKGTLNEADNSAKVIAQMRTVMVDRTPSAPP